MDITKIMINKNRGWRGLAEVKCLNEDFGTEMEMIFSFSQPVWEDMQRGIIVLQDEDDYIILHFAGSDRLPKGQRSVLIKNFSATVVEVNKIPKYNWETRTRGTAYYPFIYNFIKNRNNHTTSDWNCIGIRVIPEI